jgi:hypothetical protein
MVPKQLFASLSNSQDANTWAAAFSHNRAPEQTYGSAEKDGMARAERPFGHRIREPGRNPHGKRWAKRSRRFSARL